MLNNVYKTLVQYKLILIIGGFLVVVFVAVLIFTAYAANVKADVKIQVKPTLSLGPCFNNQTAPKTSIVTPADGTKYTTGDKVSLTGIAVLECNNSKIDDANLSWYLDSDATPFATGSAANIDSIKAGNHTIKLNAVSGKLKTEVAINISAADKPKVLGIKAPPPAPPAAPNNPPTAIINALRAGNTYTANSYDEVSQRYYASFQAIAGSGNDTEDGVIPDAKLSWYVNGQPISTGQTLTGFTFYGSSPTCGVSNPITYVVKLVATDSKPQTGEAVITITINNDQSACLF